MKWLAKDSPTMPMGLFLGLWALAALEAVNGLVLIVGWLS